mmetsp:Transcript_18271/g.55137  ORF Transcript_18271/g.55137 Transcript_18271/m.55137 type:complete len:98 (+) Transcript_18271:89-382(+)
MAAFRVGDRVAIDASTPQQRHGTVSALSPSLPPLYAVSLDEGAEREGEVEYDLPAERLMPASEAPLLIGMDVILDAGTPNERTGTIHAIKRSACGRA